MTNTEGDNTIFGEILIFSINISTLTDVLNIVVCIGSLAFWAIGCCSELGGGELAYFAAILTNDADLLL